MDDCAVWIAVALLTRLSPTIWDKFQDRQWQRDMTSLLGRPADG